MQLSLSLSEKLLSLIRIGDVQGVQQIFNELTTDKKKLENCTLIYKVETPTIKLLNNNKKYIQTKLVPALLLNAFQNQDKLFLCAWKMGLRETLSPADKRAYIGAICGVAVKNQNIQLYEIAQEILNTIFYPNQICRENCQHYRLCLKNRNQRVRYH